MDTYTENILSLYSGAGGLDIAFRLAVPNSRTVCYVERDIASSSVLVKAMQTGLLDDAPICSASSTFDGKPWRGKVDWVIGGFPCQPWSVAGKREGAKDERWLWDDIKQIISEIQPKGIFLENVPGLLTGHGIDPILGTLSELGYDTRWGNVKASDVGSTHRRARIFILAYHRSFGWRRWNKENNKRFKLAVQTQRPFGSRGEHLGYTESKGLEGHPEYSSTISSEGNSRSKSRTISSEMDDTEHVGRNRTQKQGSDEETISNNSQGQNPTSESQGTGDTRTAPIELGVFPPGPKSEEWDYIRQVRPSVVPAIEKSEIESKIRGMAHGLDGGLNRVDRLRVVGNGVVPLQAAYAFKLLMDKI